MALSAYGELLLVLTIMEYRLICLNPAAITDPRVFGWFVMNMESFDAVSAGRLGVPRTEYVQNLMFKVRYEEQVA